MEADGAAMYMMTSGAVSRARAVPVRPRLDALSKLYYCSTPVATPVALGDALSTPVEVVVDSK